MRPIHITSTVALIALLGLSLPAQAQMPEVPDEAEKETAGDKTDKGAVSLNLVDQKLALSLAVDMHGQMDLTQFALEGVTDEVLRRALSTRLDAQRDFSTQLETLTSGRSKTALDRA